VLSGACPFHASASTLFSSACQRHFDLIGRNNHVNATSACRGTGACLLLAGAAPVRRPRSGVDGVWTSHKHGCQLCTSHQSKRTCSKLNLFSCTFLLHGIQHHRSTTCVHTRDPIAWLTGPAVTLNHGYTRCDSFTPAREQQPQGCTPSTCMVDGVT
jgi:hypothetical protein